MIVVVPDHTYLLFLYIQSTVVFKSTDRHGLEVIKLSTISYSK